MLLYYFMLLNTMPTSIHMTASSSWIDRDAIKSQITIENGISDSVVALCQVSLLKERANGFFSHRYSLMLSLCVFLSVS